MRKTTSIEEYIANQPRYTWRRWILRKLVQIILFTIIKIEVTGLENVPDSGPSLLMMNHISFLDPVYCYGVIENRYVISMSKQENMSNIFLGTIIKIYGGYVVKRGAVDRQALTNSIELMKSGQLILIAPEGTRHPEGLAPAKDGLAYVATKADAIIIPATISGAQDAFSRLKRLRRGYARINFGKPFRFKTGDQKRINRDDLSKMTQEAMYQLALAIPDEYEAYRGAYRDVEKSSTDYIEFINPADYSK